MDRTPVLIGAGQAQQDWDGKNPAEAPLPIGHVAVSVRRALEDTGAGKESAANIDTIAFIRRFADSMMPGQGDARIPCPPAALADAVNLTPRQMVYATAGGQTPQALVNEFATRIFEGDCDTVLIAGGEVLSTMKQARKSGVELDWSALTEPESHQSYEDRGFGQPMSTPYEIANGMLVPMQAYTLFEHALRLREGRGSAAHVKHMSELLAPFSDVAAANEFSEYKRAYTAEELATSSSDNFPVTDIYLKGHVAKNTVNHSAAVILTTVDKAREMGVPEENWVYLHGGGDITELPVIERPDLSRSPAMDKALGLALGQAGKTISEIEFLDLYSCFPCALFFATEALGLDWRARQLTLTGGLPFFGGAGNGYSLNAIAAMAAKLKEHPDSYGLVLANGGFMQKQSAGVYSRQRKDGWAPPDSRKAQAELDATARPVLDEAPEEGRIMLPSVSLRKGEADFALIIGETGKGRFMAKARREDAAMRQAMLGRELAGHPVLIERTDKANYFKLQ